MPCLIAGPCAALTNSLFPMFSRQPNRALMRAPVNPCGDYDNQHRCLH